ncbi:MAG: hypothetical protein QG670_297 [Thermoproteota archaeon]|nr:hypothetical protein [Thermoproteota archaeon]
MPLIYQIIPILSDLIGIIVNYLPKIVLAVIVIALGWIIGRLLSSVVGSIAGKMRMESSFRKVSIGRAILRGGHTPSTFFASLTKGIIYLLSILFALELLTIPVLTDFVQVLINFIPNLVGGVLILIVGFIFVDWIGEAIEKGSLSTAQPSILGNIVRVILYFMVVTIALAQLKVDVTILYIFSQAFAWSLAIATGIALGWNLKDKIRPLIDSFFHDDNDKDTE